MNALQKQIELLETITKNLSELPKYWVLVIGNNRNEDLNGKPLPPIDAERGVWHGMLVYPSEGQALRAAEHYNKLYDRKCYPVLLGNEVPRNQENSMKFGQSDLNKGTFEN